MKRWFLFVVAAGGVLSPVVSAEPPRLTISLAQAVEATLQQSNALKAAALYSQAAEERARSERGKLMPTVAVEGSARRISDVPKLTLPSGVKQQLSDNESYSIGPAAHYTLFRGGKDWNAYKSAQAKARSARLEEQLVRRREKLAAQLAYFQAQLASEQVRLLLEAFKLDEEQYKDINNRFSAGASTRVDLLSAHQQMLNRRRLLLDARGELAAALRELTRLTGLGVDVNPQFPLSEASDAKVPAAIEPATVILEIAAPGETVHQLEAGPEKAFDENQPGIAFLTELAEASDRAAKSWSGGRWPELSVLGKVSRDYPNGPVQETITQHTVGASLQFPLFTGGQLAYAARAQQAEAKAAAVNRDEQARQLLTSWQKAKDQIAVLLAQRPLYDIGVRQAKDIAALQYQLYRGGRGRYLDVEDANLKVLQLQTSAAYADVRMLIQLATVESLSQGE